MKGPRLLIPTNKSRPPIDLTRMTNYDVPVEMHSVTLYPTNPLTAEITKISLPTTLAPDSVLIKVHAAASNPKDVDHLRAPFNSGDDLAGTVAAVGSNVRSCQIGNRVAAFHPMGKEYGSYAEFAVAPMHTVFKIPTSMEFEEASTIPLVSLTAAITLFRRQGFVAPWLKDVKGQNKKALIVYAASSSLGTFAIKLARLAGIGPIVAIGGGSSGYVRDLLGEEDLFLDYRCGWEKLSNQIEQWLEEQDLKVYHALDCFSAQGSWVNITKVLDTDGLLSVFSGSNRYDEKEIPESVRIVYTFVGTGHEGAYRPGMPKQAATREAEGDIAFAGEFFKWLERVLEEGEYDGHPCELVPGGLAGVVNGLNQLKAGRAGGRKFVYRIVD